LVSDGPYNGFLITEAIRGEGARLLSAENERFVDELAPRDEVARAIDRELARSGKAAVLLDMREVDARGFPNVVEALAAAGLDPRRDLIPVAPAAHYMIGGVATDVVGRSTLPGLYSVGECACAGVHGANRLASNSLSECFVFGRRAALAAAGERGVPAPTRSAPRAERAALANDATRSSLWRDAGIVRDGEGLRRLSDDPHLLVRLIARSALAREESRGCHLRSDFPDRDPRLEEGHFVLAPGDSPARLERWE
jgi:L-aspartate oxidase